MSILHRPAGEASPRSARPAAALRRSIREFQVIAQDPVLLISLLLIGAALVVFIIYPLFEMLKQSFLNKGVLNMEAYRYVLLRPLNLRVIGNTLQMGVLAALGSTAVGFLFAYVLVRIRTPLRPFIQLMALLPIISPPFAVGMAAINLFGRSGLITKGIFHVEPNIYGLSGLVLVQVLTFFPVAYLIFEGLLQALNPSLEEAALNMGASKGRIFRTVTLPLLIPGFAGALLIIFIESLADLGNPILLGGNFHTLALQTWIEIIGQSNFQLGAAYSVVLLVPSLLAFVVQRYWVSRKSYISVTGKPQGGQIRVEEPYIKYPLLIACILISVLVLLLYLTIFYGAFAKLWGQDFSPTLNNFVRVWDRGQEAIVDSLFLSAAATPVAGILGMIIAFLVVRKAFAGKTAMDFVSMLGAAVPGTVLGLGYLFAFNHPPLQITNTAWILIICFAVRSIPTGIRAGIAALQQIDPSIEEASTNLGADAQHTFRKVTLPLIQPALLAGMIFAFTRHMTSLSAIIFLVSPRWKLITKEALDLVEWNLYGDALAYCVVIILAVLAAIVVLYALLGRTVGVKDIVKMA